MLPGTGSIEVDDDIVLEGSNPFTGVRIKYPDGTSLEREVFTPTCSDSLALIELYPIDKRDEPIDVEANINSYSLTSDVAIIAMTKATLVNRTVS
jgi:hypothetical protein